MSLQAVQTVSMNNMNPMNPQQQPMYGYAAYAPPAYHGHTGYAQPAYDYTQAPPGCNWGAPAAFYQIGVPAPPPQHQQQPPQQAPPPAAALGQLQAPHENDVLMGRGGKNNQHVGNERLRDMARSVRDRYKASAKKGKSNMSRELVQKVRDLEPPGRFLKRNPVTSEWEDVGDEVAREKVSQVLRDAVSEWTGPKAQAKEKEAKEKEEPVTSNSALSTEPQTDTNKPAVAITTATATASTAAEAHAQAQPEPPQPTQEDDHAAIAVPATPTSEQSASPAPPDTFSMRSRADTAESEISLDDDVSLPEDLEETASLADLGMDASSDSHSTATGTPRRGNFRRMPVAHVPFTSFRNKRKTNLLDRYSNMNMGTSTSDMSIQSINSLSSRNLGTQLSSRQLMSTGARQMSSRQLSSRQLSNRQLSSRQLSSRQLSSRSGLSLQQRKQNFAMMGESDLSLLSLDALSISGHSRQLSRKNVFMDQYMAMDMGLSDFSLGSLPEGEVNVGTQQPPRLNRPSVIIEGDLEENFSEHSNCNAPPGELMDLYATSGVGTSIRSNMTIGTFSGHSRASRGLYATGNSMRLDSGHSFLAGPSAATDLQLDMLDDDLFDQYDLDEELALDDDDEFSSEFC